MWNGETGHHQRILSVEKVKKEYGSNESMLYMPIVNLWDKEAVATIQTFIKNFTQLLTNYASKMMQIRI